MKTVAEEHGYVLMARQAGAGLVVEAWQHEAFAGLPEPPNHYIVRLCGTENTDDVTLHLTPEQYLTLISLMGALAY